MSLAFLVNRDLSTLTATMCLSVQANKTKIITQHKHTFQGNKIKQVKQYNLQVWLFILFYTLITLRISGIDGMREGLQDLVSIY